VMTHSGAKRNKAEFEALVFPLKENQ